MTAEMTDLIRRIARPEARDLPAYNAGLSSDAVRQRFGLDTIARLGSNENPFGPSPAVGAALRDMADAIGQYPDANSTALRAAIAARTGVEPADIVVGNGSENLLELLCLAFLSPGDRVVTLLPSFGLHEIFPRMMGAQVDMVPVTDSMEFDIDAWCAALGGGARPPRMAILSNPSNPVGCMLDADAFDRVVRAAPPETLLVIDEAYYEYARLTPGFPDVLTRLRAQERPWIVLRTFSKAWGLAGLRVGYGLAHPDVAELMNRVRQPFNVNHLAMVAACAALDDDEFIAESRRVNAEGLAQLAAGFARLGLEFIPSAGNFVAVRVGEAARVYDSLLRQGVIVRPVAGYGMPEHLRVTVGTAAQNERFLAALGRALAESRSGRAPATP